MVLPIVATTAAVAAAVSWLMLPREMLSGKHALRLLLCWQISGLLRVQAMTHLHLGHVRS